jgi:hypothetical protein
MNLVKAGVALSLAGCGGATQNETITGSRRADTVRISESDSNPSTLTVFPKTANSGPPALFPELNHTMQLDRRALS